MDSLILGDSLDLLVDNRGKNPPFVPSGIPVISAKAIKNSVIVLSEARFISDETYSAWMPKPLRKNDVILTSEAPLGECALVVNDEPLAIAQRLYALRGKTGVLDSRYLFYALRSDPAQQELRNRSSGTTVFGIRQPELLKVRIPDPGYAQQVAIATVLGALDDKIAVNKRISAISVELADTAFTYAVSGVDFGEETFGSIATVAGGGTPSTKDDTYWDGDIAWTTPTDVTALSAPYLFETSRTISPLGLESCASQLYPAHSIFMTSRATIGAFALPQVPAAVNQGFIVVLPRSEEMRWWLLHEMRSRVDEMISLANGSTFLELSRKNFKAMAVRLAEPETIREFACKAALLHAAAAHASRESKALAGLRDTLLPQLMSGRLHVKEAEKIVEDMT